MSFIIIPSDAPGRAAPVPTELDVYRLFAEAIDSDPDDAATKREELRDTLTAAREIPGEPAWFHQMDVWIMFVHDSVAAEVLPEFNKAFFVSHATRRSLSATLVAEEAQEAVGAITNGTGEEMAGELADLVYVIYGTAISWGIDLDLAVRRVHASNMTKLDGDGFPLLRGDGKVLKSDRYQAPQLSDCLGPVPS